MENLANKICQPTKAELLSQLEPILTYIQQEAPLIHCITNPISINDCANILLAIGARPIMAEHPDEVAEITAIAKGLALNLGNITDARMASMKISLCLGLGGTILQPASSKICQRAAADCCS